MSNILCIDDEPDAPKIANKTLRQILHDIYNTSPYEVIFETNGDKGIEIAGSDKDTTLVLLDVEFKKQKKQGDMIAKELLKVRPELKVIVLTRFTETGKKISFGHKRNVVHYVIKEETASLDIQNKVKNLSHAIIEDYENKDWQLEYNSPETITLSNGKESYGINIPITAQGAIADCIKSPNRPVSLSESFNLNKAHNMINNNVKEGTDWKTWGILTREGCAKGQLKLMIGSVISSQAHQTPKDPYVTQSQFEMFMKDFERFKKEVSTKLEDINKTKSGDECL
ncbi:MAG: hypothetical protein H8E54_10840 [Candidatus Aminicenantes bacterium]|nr:hypothetical protein [Candidatus Aminicenantes bacterium]